MTKVVAFSGAGRSGKSTAASAVSGASFLVGHRHEAVTTGIDAAWRKLPDGREGSLLVLDCEGAFNPSQPGRGKEISALSLLVASVVVHVEFGSLDERHLEAMAALGAGRALLCASSARAETAAEDRSGSGVAGGDRLAKQLGESSTAAVVGSLRWLLAAAAGCLR